MARFNLSGLVDRLTQRSARERRMAAILGGVVLFLVVIVLPIGLEAAVHSRLSDVDDLRAALDAVQSARGQIHDRQTKKAAISMRYGKHAPALAGLLEQLATAQKLEVVDSVDRPDQPHGKKFTERLTTIHLKKAGMLPISKFLESVEQSGYPVMVSQIDLRKRAGEPDSYDVETTISAFDRIEGTTTSAPAASSSSGSGSGSTP
jgi:general secretion pathway protein M